MIARCVVDERSARSEEAPTTGGGAHSSVSRERHVGRVERGDGAASLLRRMAGSLSRAPAIGCCVIVSLLCAPAPVRAQTSVIEMPITLGLVPLRARLASAIPTELLSQPARREVCVPAQHLKTKVPEFRGLKIYSRTVRTKISPEISCDVSARVWREGDVQLSAAGGTLLASAILRGQATVRGRGAIGQHIRESASGRLQVTVRLTPSLQSDWTLRARPQITYRWLDPPAARLFGLFDVTFAGEANAKLDELIRDITPTIESEVARLPLRAELDAAWKALQAPVQLSDNAPVYLGMRPRRIALSGLHGDGSALAMTVRLELDAEVSLGRPPARAIVPLPPPGAVGHTSGELRLTAPLRAAYVELGELLAERFELDAERVVASIGGRDIRLRFGRPRIRPRGGGTLRVELAAELDDGVAPPRPLRLRLALLPRLDTRAHRLVFELQGSRLSVGKEEAPSVLYALLFERLAERIEREFAYDFREDWERLAARVEGKHERSVSERVKIAAVLKKPVYGKLAITREGLSLIADIRGTVSASVLP